MKRPWRSSSDSIDFWPRSHDAIRNRPRPPSRPSRRSADSGLTTREACGNSVRNITGCPYAGVGADERFDVTPYAEALTRFLLRHRLSSVLPRKFKIALRLEKASQIVQARRCGRMIRPKCLFLDGQRFIGGKECRFALSCREERNGSVVKGLC